MVARRFLVENVYSPRISKLLQAKLFIVVAEIILLRVLFEDNINAFAHG